MRKVPRRNISGQMSDILHPAKPLGSRTERSALPPPPLSTERLADFVDQRPEVRREPIKTRMRRPLTRRFISVLAATAFLLLVTFGIGIYNLKQKLSTSVALGLDRFNSAVSDFRIFDFKNAKENVAEGTRELQGLSGYDGLFAGSFLPFFKDASGVYEDIQMSSNAALAMMEEFNEVLTLWPRVLRGEGGQELVASLSVARDRLIELSEAGNRLMSQSNKYKEMLPFDPSSYLALQLDLNRTRSFLDILIPWLSSNEPHRLVVFLENPSELRPGGGFIGSYAELLIERGSLKSIEVRDVAYADRELDLLTVPPEPLQALVKNWRAADANWFFDFAESAEKTLAFLEASETYRRSGIRFDGAIGLSANAVSDLLALSGPIKLSSGKEMNSTNFLSEIQAEVQAGHDVGSVSSKKILSELAPVLLGRIADLSAESQQDLFEKVSEWVAERDIRVYFKDIAFERYFDGFGVTGKLMEVNPEWSGDYLAIANANIGGGKTDIKMQQKVVWQATITSEGRLNDHLVIKRTHSATEEDDWWYTMENRNYLKVFTPANVQLEYANGGWERVVKPQVKYSVEGYSTDPDVSKIETSRFEHLTAPAVSSFLESGKNVFATWSKTAKGATSELTFDYSRRLLSTPSDGSVYQFVFEKQSGATGDYEFEFTAPVGFRFKENGMPVFNYKTNDPPGRLVLDLTLEKI